MSCCSSSSPLETTFSCPQNGDQGEPIQLITLKSLLKPSALERLKAKSRYRFCDAPDCSVVYFSHQGDIFTIQDVKVPVFQKSEGDDIPVCYCFGWSRRRIQDELAITTQSTAVESITAHVRAERCGCAVNNPQGSCCLGNVKQVVQQSQQP